MCFQDSKREKQDQNKILSWAQGNNLLIFREFTDFLS